MSSARRRRIFAAFLLAMLAGVPAGAPARVVETVAAIADLQRQIGEVEARARAGDFKGALRLIERIDARLERGGYPVAARVAIASMQAITLAAAGRHAEANAAIDRVLARSPNDPAPLVSLYTAFTGFGGFPEAGYALERIAGHFPDAIPDLDITATYNLLRWTKNAQGEAAADRWLERLGDGGFGRGRPASHDDTAVAAARLHLARGERAEAARLMAQLSTTEAVTRALIDRRFEPLWPALETAAGPHRERIDALATMRAEAALARAPADPQMRQDAIEALVAAGRLTEAEALGRTAVAPAATLDAEQAERIGWVIDAHANTLFKLGRYDAADARAGELAGLDMAQHPWAIGPAINRIERLVGAKRYDAATARMAEITAQAATYGNPYAQQLVRRLRVCALAGLGRDTAAATTELMAHAAESATATIDGTMCVGRTDDAAAGMIRKFGGSDWDRRQAIELMQPDDVFGGGTDPSLWAAAYARLRSRPDVIAAFAPVGRVLPNRLRPVPTDATRR